MVNSFDENLAVYLAFRLCGVRFLSGFFARIGETRENSFCGFVCERQSQYGDALVLLPIIGCSVTSTVASGNWWFNRVTETVLPVVPTNLIVHSHAQLDALTTCRFNVLAPHRCDEVMRIGPESTRMGLAPAISWVLNSSSNAAIYASFALVKPVVSRA